MSEYLSKEEIKQWRSSLEKITLEEFAFDIAPDGLVLDSTWTDSSTVDTAHAWPVGIGKIIADGWQMTY